MSKNSDSKDEAMNNEPDKTENVDSNAEGTAEGIAEGNAQNDAQDPSAVKYDVVFDDDADALDLGSLAVSGQISDDVTAEDAEAADDADDADDDGNDNTESETSSTNDKGNTKESDSMNAKAAGGKTGHVAKQSSSTSKSKSLKDQAQYQKSNGAQQSDAGKETGDNDGKTSSDDSESVAASNAQRVNETLGLAVEEEDELSAHEAKSPVIEPATAVSTRLDKETISEADILLKPNPTFALDHVTFTNRKSGRSVLDNIDWGFFAGSLYAITGADDEQRRALLAVASGFYRPERGQVMVKSQSLLELETNEIRGHRIGLITQRYSLRDDLDPLTNLTFTMRASGRTFLKPVPIAARDVLKYVDFDEAATGVKVSDLKPVNQRRLAIARAICCEATVILADDPVGGLDTGDRMVILDLLARIAHAQDPKRCVIVLVPGFGSADESGNAETSENDNAKATTDLDEYTSSTDYEAKADKVYSF